MPSSKSELENYTSRFKIAAKHACDYKSFSRELDLFNRRNESTRFKEIIQFQLDEYKDLYNLYLVTFVIEDKNPKQRYEGIPELRSILIKTFNAFRKEFFGNKKEHQHLDFLRLGFVGIGKEESCGDHYHFLISLPPILLPKLELIFRKKLEQVHPVSSLVGRVHVQVYNGDIRNILNYGTRYFESSEKNIAYLDGIDWSVSSHGFSIHESNNDTYELHKRNLAFYQKKNQHQVQINVLEHRSKKRVKDCPKSDRRLLDAEFRAMF